MTSILSQLESLHPAHKIVAWDACQSLTTQMLAASCNRLAKAISDRNITTLALHGDNSSNWLIIDIACQLASVCLIPIPTFFSDEQIRHVFKCVSVDAIISEQPDIFALILADKTLRTAPTSVGRYCFVFPNFDSNDIQLPANTGKITFTSGSTGQPKGVCLSNQQLIIQAQALVEAVGLHAARHLCLLPLSTLLENIAGLYTPLLASGEVIIPGLSQIGFTGSSTLDPHRFIETITSTEPDSMILTPQLLSVLVAATESGWQPPSSLKFVAVGGGKVSDRQLIKAHQMGIPAYEGYGLSECASVVCLNTPRFQKDGRCGRPLEHLNIEIEAGEIVVSGNAMLGYVGEPSSWGKKRIYTGDLGTIDADGYLQINGRKKNLLISSYGRNINPEWVESELLAQIRIAQCIVFGDARPYCVALIAPDNPDVSMESLQRNIENANARLPDYARVRKWHRLPRTLVPQGGLITENGRPKRAAIAARYQQQIDSLYAHPVAENQ